MKITSPWRRFALPLCLAAGSCVLPVLAQEPVLVPIPVSAAEPTPAVDSPTAATSAPEPLQAVETAPPLAAPPSSRLSRVRVSDDSAAAPKAVEPQATEPEASEPAAAENKSSDVATELIKERYPNGTIKVEREMAQDRDGNYVLHGVFRQYDERGQILCEGSHDQGQPCGVWKRYYYTAAQAPLFGTSPYKDFAAPYISQASFEDGQIHGKWTISDGKSRKISEIEFASGQRHGKAAWYYPNGTLLSQASYDRGRVHGDVMKWGPDASLLGKESYTHGRKLAPKLDYYDAEHKRSEIFFLHAPMVVKSPDNYSTATLATFEQPGQDEKYGSFRVWHANGQLARQGEFRYNLPVGKATWFFANGQKQMEGSYVDGKQDGTWVWWHTNGLKQIQGDYKEGAAVGKWQWWKEDGKLAQKSNMTATRVANIPAPLPDSDEGTVRR